MDKRLAQFIQAENISQAQFADSIGVARASVSHILAGRNRPGFEFIENMAKRYPALNIEWLITGKGRMYKGESVTEPPQQPISAEMQDGQTTLFDEYDSPAPVSPITETKTLVKETKPIEKQRSIKKIVIFYDDNTFQELK